MKIEDRIYGTIELKEPVFEELINSPSFQRLKDISQLGLPDRYSSSLGFSRYEHSVGVTLLLRKLGADISEQVAGLLHDISHAPFSHLIDWVIGDPTKEDYQDNTLKSFIINSEIPPILAKHSFSLEKILNHSNFKLLEREAPGLCADRLDYSIREMNYKKGNSFTNKIINALTVKDNQIVFRREAEARIFGEEYMELQRNNWAGEDMRARYYIFSEILNKAIQDKILDMGFLKGTEKPVLTTLESSNDPFIINRLNLLKKGFNILQDETGVELKKKFRYIDPEILKNGGYVSLSKLFSGYDRLLENEKQRCNEFKKIRVVPL